MSPISLKNNQRVKMKDSGSPADFSMAAIPCETTD
jgi:hypothetical protein